MEDMGDDEALDLRCLSCLLFKPAQQERTEETEVGPRNTRKARKTTELAVWWFEPSVPSE